MKKQILFAAVFLTINFLSAQKIGQVTQGLSVLESSLWPDKTCNVCWENPSTSDATERGWVQDAVTSTWERESNFRFAGWATCGGSSKGIRISINDVRPNSGIGKGKDGVTGMELNFTFNDWGNDCKGTREFCIRTIAVHEFGHALGFEHEQSRTDAPLDCQKDIIKQYGDIQGGPGDWWVTPYDAESIMNYCNPTWSNAGFLSERDKYGVRLLYGGPIIETPIIYAVSKDKNLLWYKHNGHMTGTFDWASNNGAKVGTGWDFAQVFNDGDGIFYVIKQNGELLWYNHNGYHEGTFKWGSASGQTVVGRGWFTDVQAAFAGGGGVIYLIKKNGDLHWYKHLGFKDGSDRWDVNSGTKVGSGWTDFHAAFSGGNGVIYLIANNGDLYWYKHAGYATGNDSWYGGSTNKVGTGWNSAKQVFSTGWGKIYLVGVDGKLRYYNHLGFINGTFTWGTGTGNVVGSGWLGINSIGLGSINPSKFINNLPQQIKVVKREF